MNSYDIFKYSQAQSPILHGSFKYITDDADELAQRCAIMVASSLLPKNLIQYLQSQTTPENIIRLALESFGIRSKKWYSKIKCIRNLRLRLLARDFNYRPDYVINLWESHSVEADELITAYILGGMYLLLLKYEMENAV